MLWLLINFVCKDTNSFGNIQIKRTKKSSPVWEAFFVSLRKNSLTTLSNSETLA